MARIAVLVVILVALAAPAAAERLAIRAYSTADGLPEDRVKCVFRDSRGVLWVCTSVGFAWFDGRRFNTYGTADGLPHPSVNDIVEDRDARYWIATNGGGVVQFDAAGRHVRDWPPADDSAPLPHRMTPHRVGASVRSNRVNALHIDRGGRLWAGTDAGLFLRAADGTFEEVALPVSRLAPYVLVWDFAESPDGTLWMATTHGLIRRRPDGAMTQYAVRPVSGLDDVSAVIITRDGRLWIGHETGLFRARADAPAFRIEEVRPAGDGPRRRVQALYESPDGTVWIGDADGALTEFDGRDYRTYTTEHGLSGAAVRAIGVDVDDNIWIGHTTGAARIATRGLMTFDLPPGYQRATVYDVFETRERRLVAVAGGTDVAIHWFDGREFQTVKPAIPPHAVREGRPDSVLQDRRGEWWIGTRQGLYRLPAVAHVRELAGVAPLARYTAHNGLPGDEVQKLFEDARGDIWVATVAAERYAIVRYRRATGVFERVAGIPDHKQVSAFAEDRRGNIWLGFRDGGLARWRGGPVDLFGAADGLTEGWVDQLFVGRAGRFWLSSGGLFYQVSDPDAATPRFERMQLPPWSNPPGSHKFVEDGAGVLYSLGRRGLDRVWPNPARLVDGDEVGRFASGVNAACVDAGGRLWFAARHGLSRLDPAASRPTRPPEVFVHGLTIAGRDYPLAVAGQADVPEIALPAHANRIEIQYWSPAGSARLQHRLAGADGDWQPATLDRAVTFASLAPGRYAFEVRAADVDAGLAAPAVVRFTIVPPLWQRAWVQALAGFALAGVVWIAHRRRVAQLVALERIRTRIATDLHDDIGSNLSRIAILSELAQRRVAGGAAEAREMLGSIGTSARELVDAMGDIVWAIRPERDGIADLSQRMRRFASDLLALRPITVTFHMPEGDPHLATAPDVRREVFLIFKEAVHNIVKHAGCTEASISLSAEGRVLELTVADNGRGFAEDGSSQGTGLASLRARAARIGGVLDITSVEGRGTAVHLRVPLGARAHLFGWRSRGAGT